MIVFRQAQAEIVDELTSDVEQPVIAEVELPLNAFKVRLLGVGDA